MTALSPQQMHYNWLMNIIESCNNTLQFESSVILINYFYAEYPKEKVLHDCLRDILIRRFEYIKPDEKLKIQLNTVMAFNL